MGQVTSSEAQSFTVASNCLAIDVDSAKGSPVEHLVAVPFNRNLISNPNHPLFKLFYTTYREAAVRQWVCPLSSTVIPEPVDRNSAVEVGLDRNSLFEAVIPAPTARAAPSYKKDAGHVFSMLLLQMPDERLGQGWLELKDDQINDLCTKSTVVAFYKYCVDPIRKEGIVDFFNTGSYCYEAKASIVLQTAAWYLENVTKPGNSSFTSVPKTLADLNSVVFRCRRGNLPYLRLLQKLLRVHGPKSGAEGDENYKLIADEMSVSEDGSVTSVKVSGALSQQVVRHFVSRIKVHESSKDEESATPSNEFRLSVARDSSMAPQLATPLDDSIVAAKPLWLTENAPVKEEQARPSKPLSPPLIPLSMPSPFGTGTSTGLSSNGMTPTSTVHGVQSYPPMGRNDSYPQMSGNGSFATMGPGSVNASFSEQPRETTPTDTSSTPATSKRASTGSQSQTPMYGAVYGQPQLLNQPPRPSLHSPTQPQPVPLRSTSSYGSPKLAPTTCFIPANTPIQISAGDGCWYPAFWRNQGHPCSLYEYSGEGSTSMILQAAGEVGLYDENGHPFVMPSQGHRSACYITIYADALVYPPTPQSTPVPANEFYAQVNSM